MKNKKGFTLVELLAVVTILGTIATVATFSTLNIIENQRKELLKEQVANLKDAALSYYVKSKRYLSVCADGADPQTLLTMSESDLKCGMKFTIAELVEKKFFENKNNVCNESKSVLIYKTSQTNTEIYVPSDACGN